MRKYDRSVFKALSILTQLGVSVMVPIAVCVGIGVFIDSKFDTWWTIPLLFLGIIAGGRNAYILAMSVAERNDTSKLSDANMNSDQIKIPKDVESFKKTDNDDEERDERKERKQ